jgi:hypothetical protein
MGSADNPGGRTTSGGTSTGNGRHVALSDSGVQKTEIAVTPMATTIFWDEFGLKGEETA